MNTETDSLPVTIFPLKQFFRVVIVFMILFLVAKLVVQDSREARIFFWITLWIMMIILGVTSWLSVVRLGPEGISAPGRKIRWVDLRGFRRMKFGNRPALGFVSVEGFYALGLTDMQIRSNQRCREKFGVDFVLPIEHSRPDVVVDYVRKFLPEVEA